MFLKIALTGIIVFIICVSCILFDGRKADDVPLWKVNMFAGGGIVSFGAIIAGTLGHIWTT